MSAATPHHSSAPPQGEVAASTHQLQQQPSVAGSVGSPYQRITVPFTNVEDTCQKLNKEALVAISKTDFEAAANYLHEAMNYSQNMTDPKTGQPFHKELAATMNNLGCLAKRLGNFVDAKKYLQDAVAAEVAAFGESMPSTQLNLSTVYTGLGQVSAALLLAQQVVDRAPPLTEGDDFPVIALHNLAVAQLCSTDVKTRKSGVDTLKHALRVSTDLLGAEHELTHTIELKLGKMHKERADKKKREKEGESALKQPAPPPGANTSHRMAAQRALRALDFNTPAEDPNTPPPGSSQRNRSAVSNNTSQYQHAYHTAQGQLAQDVMSGATFVPGPAVPPTDGKTEMLPADPNQQEQVEQQKDESGSQKTSPSKADPSESNSLTAQNLHHLQQAQQQLQVPPPKEALSKRSRSRNSEYRPFMRFAADLKTVPPPVPISFREVKAEAKIKTTDPATRDVVPAKKAEDDQGQAEKVSIFRQSLEEKKKRQEQERKDEEKLVEINKKKAEEAVVRAKEEKRLARARFLREKYSARKICLAMTTWYQKKHANRKRPRRYNLRSKDQERDEGLARSVAKFARRWLNKTAGQRLLVRLTDPRSGRRLDYQSVVNAVRKVQCAWRSAMGRQERKMKALIVGQETKEIIAAEKLYFAALVLQRWVRTRQSHEKMKRERADAYTGHILIIQRWGRRMLWRRQHMYSVLSEGKKRDFAATKIQAIWRGHNARLTVAVLRLKRKILRMRQKEQKAVRTMQRVGRGYRLRMQFNDALHQHRLAEMERKRASVTSTSTDRNNKNGADGRSQIDELLRLQTVYPQGNNRQEEMRRVEEEQRHFYLDMVVNEQAKRIADDHTQKYNRRQVDLVSAHEQNIRQHELDELRRERSAKLIQRRWRRWWYSMNDDRRHRLEYLRAELQYQHYLAKEKTLAEQIKREELRQVNDLGRAAREDKLALMAEADQETQLVLQSSPPLARDITEREAAAKEVKGLQKELDRAITKEELWLRTADNPSGVRTFRTVKEKKREDEARMKLTRDRPVKQITASPITGEPPQTEGGEA